VSPPGITGGGGGKRGGEAGESTFYNKKLISDSGELFVAVFSKARGD